MSAHLAENSLHWLRGELNLTLDRVQSCLDAYLEDPEELDELREAAGHMDQLRGALTMLDLPAAVALSGEMCRLARAISDGQVADADAGGEALIRVALRFPVYLESLQRGTPDQVLDLDPLVRELRCIREGRDPADVPEPIQLDAFNLRLVREIRPSFQKALVGLLRKQDPQACLDQLAETLRGLASFASTEDGYRVWWYSGRYVKALQDDLLPHDSDQMRLLGAVDRAIKALIDHGGSFCEYPEAGSLPQRIEDAFAGKEAAALLQARHDYDPPGNKPVTGTEPQAPLPALGHDTISQISGLLRDTLALAQDGIDRLARGDASRVANLPEIVERLASVVGVLSMVNLDGLAEMVREQEDALRCCADRGETPSMEQLEKLAAKLVLIEDGLDVIGQPVAAQQAISRTQSVGSSDSEASIEASRRALARFGVVREALADIATVRELATACCWDETGSESWSKLSPVLHRLANVLTVLDLIPGADMAHRLAEIVTAPVLHDLARGDSPATNALAEALVGIEYYVEGETATGQPREQGLTHAAQRLARLEALMESVGAELPQAIPEQSAEFPEPEVVDALGSVAVVGDGEPCASMEIDEGETDTLEVESHAEIVAGSAPSFPAEPLLDVDEGVAVLEEVTAPIEEPLVDAASEHDLAGRSAIGEVDSLSGVDSNLPSELPFHDEQLPRGELNQVQGEALAVSEFDDENLDIPVADDAAAPAWADHEFLDIFLEEANGEIEQLRAAVRDWEQDPGVSEVVQPIRRAFHTLKGSGRMVGADKAGEFAWALEDMLNGVLDDRLRPDGELVSLVAESVEVFADLISHMEAGDEAVEVAHLVGRINGLSKPAMTPDSAPDPEAGATNDLQIPADADTDGADVDAVALESSNHVDSALENAGEFDELREASLVLLGQVERDLGTSRDQEGCLSSAEPLAKSFEALRECTARMGMDDLAELAETVDRFIRTHISFGRNLDAHALEVLSESAAEAYRKIDGLRGSAGRQSRMAEVLRRIQDLGDQIAGEAAVMAEAAAQAVEPVVASEPELDPELVEVFVQEAADILDSTEVTLDRWAREPKNFDLLTDLRREMHTLKGSSRMAGFMVIGDLAHAMESLLDEISRGSLPFTSRSREVLQRCLDRLHAMVETSQQMCQPGAAEELVAELHACAAAAPEVSNADQTVSTDAENFSYSTESSTAAAENLLSPALHESNRRAPSDAVMLVPDSSEMVRISSDLLDRLGDLMGESSIFRARVEQGVNHVNFNLREMEQTVSRLSEKLRRLEIETEAQILFRYERGGAGKSDFEDEFDPLELDRFSELQQLSRSLMEVVNDLSSIHTSLDDEAQELETLLQQQGKVNREIQEGLMRTRMVRFDSVVPRMRRVVRQAADELGKRADLILDGGGELERSLLDHVVAPLEHILRNAVSHGIESTDDRRKAGKPEIGTIKLAVRREGSELVIEVADDGAGIDFDKVRSKAERLGMLAPGQPVGKDVLISCLMQPGFSTADTITQVAGRGVGMDVVHDAVVGFGGSLGIDSDSGSGTRLLMRMPFSLSLAQALVVRAGGDTYAVPLAGIEAMSRLDPETVRSYIEQGRGSVEYGGIQYDIHSLGALLGGAPPEGDALERHLPAMLVRSDGANVALQVDQVIGSQEIIVKPVGTQVSSVPGISGATITADGSVVLILEMAALVRNFVARQTDAVALAQHESRQVVEETPLQIMVVDDSITMRKVTSRLVERHGMLATVAKDGLDAAGQLEDAVPDVVVLDIEMPRMDGFELAAHIRNQEHLWHLPIIMVTSRSGDKHRQRAMDLGVNAYLGKPYREEELLSALRQVLGPRGEQI